MRFLDESAAPRPSLPALKALSVPAESPASPDQAALEAHMARSRYGRFTLTEAVRPGWQLDIVPRAGYRHDAYTDPQSGAKMPALVAAVSAEHLFETFLELLEPLGDDLDVVLESSHEEAVGLREYTREGIERCVLESLLWEYEDLLLNDGCTGIAVLHPEQSLEVQLDEHKLLVVYAQARQPFERILRGHGLDRDDRLRLISQGEHMHTSHARHLRQFEELAARIGCR
ncbi:MAG: hypothetical protein RLZZ440_2784 [Planctomycetota bacterium]|jgi:hypothetical protein